MPFNPAPEAPYAARPGERGAALVLTLLCSTLLLMAGGALILKTSGSVGVAYDSTTEMQAYYAAEAGLQSALNVMRGNVENGAADKATFRDALTNNNGNLSNWLEYNDNNVIPVGDFGYTIQITDPDNTDLTDPETQPRRLLITATGVGPRGSRKQLELLLKDMSDIEVPGAVMLRGNSDGTGGMTLDLGNSSGREFLTDDADPKPVFVVSNVNDSAEVVETMADDVKNNGTGKATYGVPPLGDTSAGTAEMPDFLSDPATTETFIDDMKSIDEDDDTLFIYEGDHSHSGAGSGTLIVTGKLTIHGSFSWNGLILVLGEGSVEWKGGGNEEEGNINGAMFIANYDRNDLAAGYGDPSFVISGGGKGTLSYNRDIANAALAALGVRVSGVQEK